MWSTIITCVCLSLIGSKVCRYCVFLCVGNNIITGLGCIWLFVGLFTGIFLMQSFYTFLFFFYVWLEIIQCGGLLVAFFYWDSCCYFCALPWPPGSPWLFWYFGLFVLFVVIWFYQDGYLELFWVSVVSHDF